MFTTLSFGLVPALDIFQQQLNKSFKDIPNVLALQVTFFIGGDDEDGRDHKRNLKRVMQMHWQENLKLK